MSIPVSKFFNFYKPDESKNYTDNVIIYLNMKIQQGLSQGLFFGIYRYEYIENERNVNMPMNTIAMLSIKLLIHYYF